MNNPLDLLKMISNPKQYAMNYIKQVNNPIVSNMINLAEQGKMQEVESIAKNFFKSQGVDFEKEVMPLIRK